MDKNIIAAIAEGNPNIVIQITAADLLSVIKQVYEQETVRTQQAIDDSVYQPTISQTEAKEILGVSDSTLWRWEQGEYLIPVRLGRKKHYRKSDIDNLIS